MPTLNDLAAAEADCRRLQAEVERLSSERNEFGIRLAGLADERAKEAA
jgi:hypothetical protein